MTERQYKEIEAALHEEITTTDLTASDTKQLVDALVDLARHKDFLIDASDQ